jgi:virginiamycin A acetyltransferase
MVDALLSIAWWDWPIDKISRNLRAIAGADIETLLASA